MSEGKKSPLKLKKQPSIVSFSKLEEDDEDNWESSFTDGLDIKQQKSSWSSKKYIAKSVHIKEKGVIKIITILFMSHRIQAKIYESDTF